MLVSPCPVARPKKLRARTGTGTDRSAEWLRSLGLACPVPGRSWRRATAASLATATPQRTRTQIRSVGVEDVEGSDAQPDCVGGRWKSARFRRLDVFELLGCSME